MTEKQHPDYEKPNKRRTRDWINLDSISSYVEQQIVEAQERGEFDNLPGEGKPLLIEENEYAGDKALSYKMLKDNGFTLPWIADRNEAMEMVTALRGLLERQWRMHGPELVALGRAGQGEVAKFRWRALRERWQAEVDDVNKLVEKVNMQVPLPRLKLFRVSLSRELAKAGVSAEFLAEV